MINSLTDIINKLNLDVYKRVDIEKLKTYEKEINNFIYDKVNEECTKVVNSIPPKTYINQPKYQKFFLPPIPELLKELKTTIDDEMIYRAYEEDKMKNEKLICFYMYEGLLIILTQTKENNYVYYTYNYDYEHRHEVILMSRVEYRED